MSIFSTAVTSSNLRGAAPDPGAILERDTYAPNFELIIRGGKGAAPHILTNEIKQCIDEISYEDNADQFDHMTIKLKNQMDDSGGGDILSLIDSVLFADGQIVEIQMGYGASVRTVGACEIVRKTPHFPESDFPELTIEGYDLLHKAARRRPRGGVSYAGFRDSQIISIIGERNGFAIDAKDPRSFAGIQKIKKMPEQPRTQHAGISDYEYAKKIADIHGFSLFSKFDPDTKQFMLYFRPPAPEKQKEVLTFTYSMGEIGYHSSLLSFTPTMDAGDMSSDFEILIMKDKDIGSVKHSFYKELTLKTQKDLNENRNRRFPGKLDRNEGKLKPEDNGFAVAFKAFGRSFRFKPHIRFKSEFAARNAIQQFIQRQKENLITGNGVLMGHEGIQSGQIHRLEGLGAQFSGKYYFTKVVHRITRDGGYKTEFCCRKVIEKDVVESNPALEISSNSEIVDRVKKFKDKKTKPVGFPSSEESD